MEAANKASEEIPPQEVKVIYKFCDLKEDMTDAWKELFKDYIPERIQVYQGDIFKEGPAADAIVSPANSFGFMDGGIDMVYSRHFGWQMQTRLQEVIQKQKNGELLVGDTVIIPTMERHNQESVDWSKYNEGQPIKYLISAPTMRIPMDVFDTANAYLAFRGIILGVQEFNKTAKEPITSVLCPGLGTAVGRMPANRCAFQMLRAFEIFEMGMHPEILKPLDLMVEMREHISLTEYKKEIKQDKSTQDKAGGPPVQTVAEDMKNLKTDGQTGKGDSPV